MYKDRVTYDSVDCSVWKLEVPTRPPWRGAACGMMKTKENANEVA